MILNKRKIVLVGTGMVGMSFAYSALNQAVCDELVLVDIDRHRAEGEAMDLNHGVAFAPSSMKIYAGDYSDCADADIVVICAGVSQKPGESRLDLLKRNTAVFQSIIGPITHSGFSGIFLVATNPVDIMTRVTYELSGFNSNRVFGTGTGLDTSRLLSALARQTGIDHKSITAYMMGEHGNAQFAPWSCVSFRGKPLDDWAKTDQRFRFDREALQKESIDGGWVTFAGKFCTEYGIATTAARMVSIVLHDEKAVMPASAELDGEYGERGLFVGVPCVIGRDGVEQVVELPLTAEEKAKFHDCCEGVRRNMEHLKDIP